MEEADKDWMMIRMVGGWLFLLVLVHLGSPRWRAVKWLLYLAIDFFAWLTLIDSFYFISAFQP